MLQRAKMTLAQALERVWVQRFMGFGHLEQPTEKNLYLEVKRLQTGKERLLLLDSLRKAHESVEKAKKACVNLEKPRVQFKFR